MKIIGTIQAFTIIINSKIGRWAALVSMTQESLNLYSLAKNLPGAQISQNETPGTCLKWQKLQIYPGINAVQAWEQI